MVIHSTDINKTNNPFSSKRNSLNTKTLTTYDVGIPDTGLVQEQKCDEVKPIDGIQSLLFWKLDLKRPGVYLLLTRKVESFG